MVSKETENPVEGASTTDSSSETLMESVPLKGLCSFLDFLHVEVESQERESREQPNDAVGKHVSHNPVHEPVKSALHSGQLGHSSVAALHGTIKNHEFFLCKS